MRNYNISGAQVMDDLGLLLEHCAITYAARRFVPMANTWIRHYTKSSPWLPRTSDDYFMLYAFYEQEVEHGCDIEELIALICCEHRGTKKRLSFSKVFFDPDFRQDVSDPRFDKFRKEVTSDLKKFGGVGRALIDKVIADDRSLQRIENNGKVLH